MAIASAQLYGLLLLGFMLGSCGLVASQPGVAEQTRAIASPVAESVNIVSTPSTSTLWAGEFSEENWMEAWGAKRQGRWGLQNLEVMTDPTRTFDQILRVHYPSGSASPSVARESGVPIGGAQFYANLNLAPQNKLRLSYYVRFSEDFDFVKGGKLPGLFGGVGNSGGIAPDGTDGFSTRFMWRRQGDGEVYAYIPSSDEYGTSIGRGDWQFRQGTWHHIEQELTLNQPGQEDGRIQVWFDGTKVLDQDSLVFRTVDRLKIDGLFFSTFFGGGDPSWATPKDVYADFAEFKVQ